MNALPETIQSRIMEIRGMKVMLDFELAELYEVETKRLKEAVRRNIHRFPADFMFELTQEEFLHLRTQFATSKQRGGTRYMPFAFTEQGVAMLSSVLHSEKAIAMNIAIMRAFVLLRNHALTYQELSDRLASLEASTNQRFSDVFQALDYLINEKQIAGNQQNRRKIGYKTD